MKPTTKRILTLSSCGLFAGVSMSALQGCDPDAGGIPGCDISCPAEGIVEGNASITGIAQVDAFFGAAVDVSAAAKGLSGTLRGELDAIALSLELQPGAAGADIAAAIQAKLDYAVSGGLKISFSPPKCEASVDVAISAAAECDANVDPGSASVSCEGACEIEGGVTASCDANAELSCTGTAPAFDCQGSCEGSCELEVEASCEGTCRGTCNGTCSVTNAQGDCAGECMGMCQGTCELSAGGQCGGMCTGSCTYKPMSGTCEADASAKCEAMAGASIECDARCEGEVTPPSVSAECEATVDAKANASVECKPPTLEVTWQWSDELAADVMAQAEFKAWVQGFKTHTAVMLAGKTKADILIESLGVLADAGAAALGAATDIVGSADIVGTFKLTSCGVPQIEPAVGIMTSAAADLSVQADASFEVFAAVGINP
ncbi:hypothetical protein [Enhygromyxa salina]|uniref:Tryptophan synthase alpha chain n=1 Tax=Enhygromyxa salina TaxID=215803 RepID=A0A2S9XFC8_9BACT|nr:hypothetical protein [Enhygromyxa salina]PRP91576.1 hypothetical protein ENSA7_82280 [Enhygromyxa salina]